MASLTPFFNHYRSTAERPTESVEHLTLLHGWGAHSLVWDELMPALLARFSVTVIDLPGMGNSPIPNAPYTLDLLAEQVTSVLPEKTHLLGWSLGGLVAIELATRLPERVLSVATLATNACFCVRDDWACAMPASVLDKFGERLKEDANGTLIRFMALNCNGGSQQQDDLHKLKQILHFCGLPAPRALREGLVILRDTDMRQALAALSQPLLMLFGENDAIVPQAAARQTQPLLAANGCVDVLTGAAHLAFLGGHQQVATRLEAFWQGLPGD